MKKFTPGDLQRLKNQVSTIQTIMETAPSTVEEKLGSLFKELGEVVDSHYELVDRYSRLRVKKNMLGRQLNHVNDRLRETKKANKTLVEKAFGRQPVELEAIEPTTEAEHNNNVVIEAPSTGRCCRS